MVTNTGHESFLVFVGIAPHPPIMVPEVGGEESDRVRNSIAAMEDFTARIIASGAQTVVVITPHAPLEPDAFVVYRRKNLTGDFARFRAAGTSFTFSADEELIGEIKTFAAADQYRVIDLAEETLDHGTAVPLYFLRRHGFAGSLVAIGYSHLSGKDHLRFGWSLRLAIDRLRRPVALIASGDLSHRLLPTAPAGFDAEAHLFDEQVVAAVADSTPEKIIQVDQSLRRRAGECGYRSMLVAFGAAENLELRCEVLSYEAPFGVGYLVAQIVNAPSLEFSPMGEMPLGTNGSDEDVSGPEQNVGGQLTSLARQAVEIFVRENRRLEPTPDSFALLLRVPGACFVSLKTKDGSLRGCIGTIAPEQPNLASEVIANAINAATYDPRFSPVTPDELNDLCYSVDVLGEPELTTFDQLDPKIYGLIVENEAKTRRGLLLPDIVGVETPEQQLEIATHKAGLSSRDTLNFYRFRVNRFRES
ncbi:MAG TPA: AmmeMemoRadiSam system protein A [Pyrinomonadaceae bacterium]|jgi:AmmeMemoRadiSam system protein A|nr:AmmeMemoRadiSam system protein A [Pyrinomonadaceae bacterium]